MGHSQSYDLRNPEFDGGQHRDPVRGVRRVNKEHQTDTQYASQDGTENFDYREDELRDRIRREQLRRREVELESLRIKQTETREPIIDAFRQSPQSSPLTVSQPTYTEFNYYDHLKHHSPTDPTSYFVLKRRQEVNGGQLIPFSPVSTAIREKQVVEGYPKRSPIFSGRLSPLQRHPEVDPHPMPRYIPPMSHGTFSKTTMTSTTTYVYRSGDDSYSKTSQVPRYDEVPVTPVTPVTTVTPVTHVTPKYDEVPVKEDPLEVVQLEKEVSMTPLASHVDPKYTTMPEYRPAQNKVVKNEGVHKEKKTYSPDKHLSRRLEQSTIHQETLNKDEQKIPFVPVKEEPRRAVVTEAPVTKPTPEQKIPFVPVKEEPRRAVVTETPESPQHVSHLHAEKRMIVGIEEMDPPSPTDKNVTYVTVVNNPGFPVYEPSERLRRHSEVSKHSIHAHPSQSTYETSARHQETQYSRRPSEDVVFSTRTKILEPQNAKCHVENCTHVEVSDTPVVMRRRQVSQDSGEKNASRITIYVNEGDENQMDGVVDLRRDGDVGEMTSTPRRCFEEKLYYNSYIPTLSLGRRPIVSFYDKLH